MRETELLSWICNWFEEECNGDWEHENQIKIETVSNPGWSITIDLDQTYLEDIKEIKSGLIEKSDNDWYFFSLKNKKFDASGDLSKLALLLSIFKEIAEKYLDEE